MFTRVFSNNENSLQLQNDMTKKEKLTKFNSDDLKKK